MEKYLFKIDTTKSTPIRILIESLKEILTDANFYDNKRRYKIDSNGSNTYGINSFKFRK